MTFLAPGAALLAAALSIPALIALYLLKLRRRPVRVSSTMFWERAEDDLQVNVPLRWVRPSLLLLLHLIILGCLIAAAGRPVVEGLGAAGSARTVLLIDTSASMGAVDPGETATRLERARERAEAIIRDARRAGDRREVAVIAFANEARTLAAFTGASATALDAVNAASQTDQPGRLDRALQLADALISDSEEGEGDGGTDGSADTTIVLLSDGSFADQPLTGAAAAAAARTRMERIGPALDVDNPAPFVDNIGITAIAARRDYADPGAVRLFIELTNAGPSEVTAPIAVSVDGEVISRRAVRIDPATPAAAGVAAETFELRNQGGGVVLVLIERDDALKADNAAATVLSAAPRPAILLVRPEAEGRDASFLISEILAELPTRQVRIVDPATYERFAAAGEVTGFDLVIFDRVAPSAWPAAPSLHFGAWPATSLLTASGEARQRVVLWSRTHPAMRDVSMDSVVVEGPAEVRVGEEVETLARGERGPLIAALQQGGHRRVVVMFEPARSTWPVQVGFTIFLANAVEYLTLRGDAEVGRSFSTTEPARLPRPPARDITLAGPVEVRAEQGREAIGVLPRAGVYIGRVADGPVAVAVNMVDAHETLARSPESLRIGGAPVAAAAAGDAPREVWWWFVAAAGVLLMVEWVVYAVRMGR